ncbi:MAG: tetratricopeptide repeat protein [Alphaproteobacteria bacterium]
MQKLAGFFLIVTLLLPCTSVKAFAAEDIAALAKKAEAGDAAAQLELGERYNWGRDGAAQDWRKAAQWFEKAAAQGNLEAQYKAGYCYRQNNEVSWDVKAYQAWFAEAAKKGDPAALHSQLEFFSVGCGQPSSPDHSVYIEWYKNAAMHYLERAKNGEPFAQEALGFMYRYGFSVPADENASKEWYAKARAGYLKEAEAGDALAQLHLGLLSRYDTVGGKTGKQWLEQSALGGNVTAAANLSSSSMSDGERRRWAMMAAAKGNCRMKADFARGMSGVYTSQYGIDYAIAAEWFRKSVEHGPGCAGAAELGVMYENGLGVGKDMSAAIEWYKRAAANPSHRWAAIDALFRLGRYYEDAKDYKQALEYYNQMGAELATYQSSSYKSRLTGSLARFYAQGLGVAKDEKKAKEMVKESAEWGGADEQYAYAKQLAEEDTGWFSSNSEAAYYWARKALQESAQLAENCEMKNYERRIPNYEHSFFHCLVRTETVEGLLPLIKKLEDDLGPDKIKDVHMRIERENIANNPLQFT